ncbi:MAG: ZIP family metal transporter [Candidatus Pacearchaeota archaeon]
MKELFYIFIATFLDSIISLIGIVSLWLNAKSINILVKYLVGFAAGTLLTGAFFHLFQESLEKIEYSLSAVLLITGFILFFIFEILLHWHHCEEEGKCKARNKKAFVSLILFGDGLHNFIDGIVIAASFLISIPFGIVSTFLIISHEVPQEIGDFGVLVYGGLKRKEALFWNFVSQATCILGGILGYFVSSLIDIAVYLLPIAAGGFIYIAASDLIPELQKEKIPFKTLVFFFLGVFLMILIKLAVE